ncbi:hypothetical protein HI914_00100 [Erysiphe necator]|nr:hypothetical protein HI914_00100 [Erysiphe necator]
MDSVNDLRNGIKSRIKFYFGIMLKILSKLNSTGAHVYNTSLMIFSVSIKRDFITRRHHLAPLSLKGNILIIGKSIKLQNF